MGTLFKRRVGLLVVPIDSDMQARRQAGELVEGTGFYVNEVGLDVSFNVKKNLTTTPNTAEIKIWNLAPSKRRALDTSERMFVRLEAGYDETSVLYEGELRHSMVTRAGADIVTAIESGDGELEGATKRATVAIGKKTPAGSVLRVLASSLGLGMGNVGTVAEKLNVLAFESGTSYHGNAAANLTTFCDSFDLSWSVQDGNIQILERGASFATLAVLSPTTGLIGSPTVDKKGILTAQALIQPGLIPGHRVRVDGFSVSGDYVVTEVEFTGSTFGDDWYANIKGKAV